MTFGACSTYRMIFSDVSLITVSCSPIIATPGTDQTPPLPYCNAAPERGERACPRRQPWTTRQHRWAEAAHAPTSTPPSLSVTWRNLEFFSSCSPVSCEFQPSVALTMSPFSRAFSASYRAKSSQDTRRGRAGREREGDGGEGQAEEEEQEEEQEQEQEQEEGRESDSMSLLSPP